MSGETEHDVSGWTVDTLRTATTERFNSITSLLSEVDKRYEQRFVAQQLAVQDALNSQEKAVNAALLAADRAVAKAEASSEKRFENVNEFRAQLADQAATLMPRGESEARLQAMAEKLDDANNLGRVQSERLRAELGGLREELLKGTATLRQEFSQSLGALGAGQATTAGYSQAKLRAEDTQHISNSFVASVVFAVLMAIISLGALAAAILKP